MRTHVQTYVQLMQSLLIHQNYLPGSDFLLNNLMSIEETQKNLPVIAPSPKQERALNLLRRQSHMDLLFQNKAANIVAANIDDVLKEEQLTSLRLRHRQALEHALQDWPSLSEHEANGLPMLIMREQLNYESSQLMAQFSL